MAEVKWSQQSGFTDFFHPGVKDEDNIVDLTENGYTVESYESTHWSVLGTETTQIPPFVLTNDYSTPQMRVYFDTTSEMFAFIHTFLPAYSAWEGMLG